MNERRAAALLHMIWTVAALTAPYSESLKPTTALHVYSEAGLEPGDLVALETLAGGLARESPALYRVPGLLNSTDSYALWLRELTQHFGVQVNSSFLDNPLGLLREHQSRITGIVRFNISDDSVNAALTYIAGQPSSELLVAAGTQSTLTELFSMGLGLSWDATGHSELDAYLLRGQNAFSGRVVSFQTPGNYANLAEYAVFSRAPTVQYSCGSANSSCDRIVDDMAANQLGAKAALGWGPEADYVTKLSAAGIYVHASDYAHDVSPMANVAVHASCKPRPERPLEPRASAAVRGSGKHRVGFMITDGDNLQWMYNGFATDPTHWWGAPARGRVPLGWTISPALVELAPAILDYLARTRSANDSFVGAPSGVGYAYPSVWPSAQLAQFGNLTAEYLARTSALAGIRVGAVNVIGDPPLNQPNMSALEPILGQPSVDGVFWYTFGAGYSGWSGLKWCPKSGKPVVGARVSLWGEGTTGTMVGVTGLVERLKSLLAGGQISGEVSEASGYSLIPVHAWSHTVGDVLEAAQMLEASGDFEVMTPTDLMATITQNVKPS